MRDIILNRWYKKLFYYCGWIGGVINIVFWTIYVILFCATEGGKSTGKQDGSKVLIKPHKKFVYVWGIIQIVGWSTIAILYFVLI